MYPLSFLAFLIMAYKNVQFKVNIVYVLQVGAYFKRYSSVSFQVLIGQKSELCNPFAHVLRINNYK